MYRVENMHWYKSKPVPPNSWYVGRPKAGDDWPLLANPFVPYGLKTRFIVINGSDLARAGRSDLWEHRYDMKPDANNRFVFASSDPIADYRRWLWHQISEETATGMLLYDMALHGDGVLLCWCSPKPCHADVIVRAIEWQRREIEDVVRKNDAGFIR